jgi:hypothetical protein
MTSDREELKQYEKRADVDVYRPILLEVINLFGVAIHTSLERTLGKYLKATDGVFRNKLREDWELEMVAKLLCTNNPAERPFAVAKGNLLNPNCALSLRMYSSLSRNHYPFPNREAYMDIYQSMSLRTLAAFSLSMYNGSHRPAESKGKQKRTENKDIRSCGSALSAASDFK